MSWEPNDGETVRVTRSEHCEPGTVVELVHVKRSSEAGQPWGAYACSTKEHGMFYADLAPVPDETERFK